MKILIIVFFAIINVNLSYSYTLDSNRINYYNSILEGLNKSYIVNYTEENMSSAYKKRILKDSTEIKDSIIYYSAVKSFYQCEIDILFYLLSFEQDTSKCLWIRTRRVGASRKTRPSFLVTEKRIASLILIENYLDNYQDSIIRIPRIPNINYVDNNQNLCLLEIVSLKEWLFNFNNSDNMRYFFKHNKRPWYKIYDYIDLENK